MNFAAYTVKDVESIFRELRTKSKGLTSLEAKEKSKQFGINQISATEIKWWQILGRQFKSPFIYLLLFAAGLAFFLGEKIDAYMIIGFVCVNTFLGFFQEYHSEKSLKLLKKFVVAKARVIRNGKEELIDSKELVPGDIVMIETGDIIPADLRLFKTNNLIINESVLTGESAPTNKNNRNSKKESKEITDANNIAFCETTVVEGQGIGVVINIGKNTVMGEVAKLTVETQRESTFEKGIAKFSKFILRMILVILVFLFVANILIKGRDASISELLLFSIALAVSVIPEALPVVTTLSLSRGALKLAQEKVVVKRLSAVEDLGSIEILCTDKTGTITENQLKVSNLESVNPHACLFYATLASSFLAQKEKEPNNAFDLALYESLPAEEKNNLDKFVRLNELPFDPIRRRNSVLIKEGEKHTLIVRGAPESVLEICNNINSQKKRLEKWIKSEGLAGHRIIAIAKKSDGLIKNYTIAEERQLEFLGLISFIDPIKPSTPLAIKQAKKLGVKVKILTGDSREVAGTVALQVGIISDVKLVITGEDLDAMNKERLEEAVNNYNVFARVSPQQKYNIIEMLQKKHEVGFLGEGINDAPALKLANVALAVDHASDIARDAADIVLLNKSLDVIINGIKNGRAVFANTIKYLKITLISNFGNFYAIAIASLLINYLPMLPVQILLLNLLSDFPMIAIATDKVDSEELHRPRSYNIREVVLMAIILGLVSTVFDFIFFTVFKHSGAATLQTCWFIGSVLTELVLIFSVRTRFAFWRAKAPSLILSGLAVLAIVVTVTIPYLSIGEVLFKFMRPSFLNIITIIGIALTYFVITEIIKRYYYRLTLNFDKIGKK